MKRINRYNSYQANQDLCDNSSLQKAAERISDPEEYRRLRYYKSQNSENQYSQIMHTENGDINRDTYGEAYSSKVSKSYIRRSVTQPVLLFQIIVCLIAALAVFVLKSIGGDIYETVKYYYVFWAGSSDVISDFFTENKTDFLENNQQDNKQNQSVDQSEKATSEDLNKDILDGNNAGGDTYEQRN